MSAIAKQAGRLTEAEIDDEIVVMRLDTGEFYSMVETSAAIWRLIDGKRDRLAILEELSREFGGDEKVIAADVDEFLKQLREAGLLAE